MITALSYPPSPPPPGYPPGPPPYQYPPRGPAPYPPLTRDKVIQDVKGMLQQNGFEVVEAHRCSAMLEIQRGYVSYFQPHEIGNVQAVLQVFIEQECKPNGVNRVYVWTSREGNQNFVHVGFFKQPQPTGEPTTLIMVTIFTV